MVHSLLQSNTVSYDSVFCYYDSGMVKNCFIALGLLFLVQCHQIQQHLGYVSVMVTSSYNYYMHFMLCLI